jgi:hypothetical protein
MTADLNQLYQSPITHHFSGFPRRRWRAHPVIDNFPDDDNQNEHGRSRNPKASRGDATAVVSVHQAIPTGCRCAPPG